MPVKFKRAVYLQGSSYRVTIPMPIAQTLKLQTRDKMEIWLDNGNIMMKKILNSENNE